MLFLQNLNLNLDQKGNSAQQVTSKKTGYNEMFMPAWIDIRYCVCSIFCISFNEI